MRDFKRCASCQILVDGRDGSNLFAVTARVVNGLKLRLPVTNELCEHCVETCELCDNLLCDDYVPVYGPRVRVRLVGGALFYGHAICAADNLLSDWAGGDVDVESTDRGAIERISVEGFWDE